MRKSIRPALYSLTLLLMFAALCGAQTVSISRSEYERATFAAWQRVSGVPRRETTTIQNYKSGALGERTTRIEEFSANRRRRSIQTRVNGKSEDVNESIWDENNVQYRREGNRSWTRVDPSKERFTVFGGRGGRPNDTSCSVGDEDDGPIRMKVYSCTEIFVDNNGKTFNSKKTYVNAVGWVLRTEWVSSENSPENITSKSVTLVDYSANKIKIQIPPIKE